jgi:hypothetical protein
MKINRISNLISIATSLNPFPLMWLSRKFHAETTTQLSYRETDSYFLSVEISRVNWELVIQALWNHRHLCLSIPCKERNHRARSFRFLAEETKQLWCLIMETSFLGAMDNMEPLASALLRIFTLLWKLILAKMVLSLDFLKFHAEKDIHSLLIAWELCILLVIIHTDSLEAQVSSKLWPSDN